MADSIKVTVVDFGRKSLMLRYVDPESGRRRHVSAGTANRKEAQKAAGKLESELREGRYRSKSRTTWDGFTEAYLNDLATMVDLGTMKEATSRGYDIVLGIVERILRPERLSELTPARLDHLAKVLAKDRSPSSVASYFRILRAALHWAKRKGLITDVPTLPKMASGAASTAARWRNLRRGIRAGHRQGRSRCRSRGARIVDVVPARAMGIGSAPQ